MTYEEWSEELRHALEKRGVSKAETERACAFWQEAFEDRTEAGMDEEEAVADLGTAKEAADAVVESLPPFQKSLLGLRQNKERTILVIALLIVGAIVWVPLVFAAALVAVSIFLALWSAIGCVWLADGAAMLSGIAGIIALIWGCTQGVSCGRPCRGWRHGRRRRCFCHAHPSCHPAHEHPLPPAGTLCPLDRPFLHACRES